MTECSEWQPIETAPKDAAILVWSQGDVSVAVGAHGVFVAMADGMPACPQFSHDTTSVFVHPSHWMPLPDPPPPPKGSIKAAEWLPKSNLTC